MVRVTTKTIVNILSRRLLDSLLKTLSNRLNKKSILVLISLISKKKLEWPNKLIIFKKWDSNELNKKIK